MSRRLNIDSVVPWWERRTLEFPLGKCQCGCGVDTSIAEYSESKGGIILGHPKMFLLHHQRVQFQKIGRNVIPWWDVCSPKYPVGQCQCGCGMLVEIASFSRTSNKRSCPGYIKGKPKKFIKGHGRSGDSSPNWKGGVIKHAGGYTQVRYKNHPRIQSGGYTLEHILVVEKAIGRHLPEKHPVHHVDHNKGNNVNTNLVVCEDESYHNLLHIRERAIKACGRADWRKCRFCKVWDTPLKMVRYDSSSQYAHFTCGAKRGSIKRNKRNEYIVQLEGRILELEAELRKLKTPLDVKNIVDTPA